MSASWGESDDRLLWSRRTDKAAVLAADFGRSVGSIRSRLKHLGNPEHKAYKRRMERGGYESVPVAKRPPVYHNPYAKKPPPAAAAPPRPTVDPIALIKSQAASFLSKATTDAAPKEKLNVNQEQKAAADQVFSGQNVFLTGAAGTGKSYLLRYIINGFEERYPGGRGKQIAITAPTGIAATHIDGTTIHSWAGIGLGRGNKESLAEKVLKNRNSCMRWRDAKVLIIDEVSMLDGTLFDSLDFVGRLARACKDKPFGGLQLVLCGDFFQLPPVSLRFSKFAFRSEAWSAARIQMVELQTVTRQAGDTQFIELLGQVRAGNCPDSASQVLSRCHASVKASPTDGIEPTKLYCTNKNVDTENNARLAQLPGKTMSFPAKDVFKSTYSSSVEKSLKGIADKKSPEVLNLKVGAQVILTRNMPDKNLVNGSRGIVLSFKQDKQYDDGKYKPTYPEVFFTNGVVLLVKPESNFHAGPGGSIVRIQLPLKLAWCLTVHKSQGMTLDRAELQLEDAFDYGQVYVALSRVTSLDGLWIRGKMLSQSIVKAHPDVVTFYGKK